jgi:hypothetical protein
LAFTLAVEDVVARRRRLVLLVDCPSLGQAVPECFLLGEHCGELW